LEPEDSKWKDGLREGDVEVFRQLFTGFSPGLVRYATSVTHDIEAAREIVQQLFLDLWEKRESLKIRQSVKTYLFSSVYHKSLNWLRHKKIRELYETDPVSVHNWFAWPRSDEERDPVMLEIIEREIGQLPDQCREVFSRSVLSGESHAEIATHLGLAIKTIENHLNRARKILRSRLKKIR
jgi:RNA polymerase sigma-70 factor (ECF subfamily)